MYVDEKSGLTNLFSRLCETCVQEVARCCAVQNAQEVQKANSECQPSEDLEVQVGSAHLNLGDVTG